MSAEGTRRRAPIERILSPFLEFPRIEAAGGILLLLCAAAALFWANSPWAGSFHHLWEARVSLGVGAAVVSRPLHFWINDGLMAVFFFVVGLEIKREVLAGELASPRRAALPIAGALGGMAVPALIFAAFNAGGSGARGWGVPMATDIAFAIGVLTLLGPRVPVAAKVFLTALAIADDIGAVLVIAFFYGENFSAAALGVAAVALLLLVAANLGGVRSPAVYALLGLGLWAAILESGIHPTVAGVLLAMTIPARPRLDGKELLARGRHLLAEFERLDAGKMPILGNAAQQSVVQALEVACARAETPMQRFERVLHPWVTYLIMPLFALANAGLALDASAWAGFLHPVTLGVLIGLIVGKPVGITLFSYLAVRFRVASLSEGLRWRQLASVAILGGIGFTMSLFIGSLAFEGRPLLAEAKLGILTASLLAGVGGFAALRLARPEAAA
jgi:Na+:H+ antiporter, NhaA family